MIVVLVVSAQREPFLSRFEKNQDTWDWFRGQGMTVYKVVGDSSILEPTVSDNVLTVPVKDSWELLGVKVWWAVSHMLKDPSVEGVFKMDDDVQINSPDAAAKAIGVLSKHEYASLAIGIATRDVPITYAQTRVAASSPWKTASVAVHATIPYASGSFMYLSRSSMNVLSSVHSLIAFAQCPIEDLTTGQLLCNAMVPLTVLTSSAFCWGHLDKTVGCSEDEFKLTEG